MICLNFDHLHQNEIKHNTALKICQTTFVQFSNSRLHSAIKNLFSHTTKNLFSHTTKNLFSHTTKKCSHTQSRTCSHTIKNLLSCTTKNLFSYSIKNLFSHTTKNLLSCTIKNLLSQSRTWVLQNLPSIKKIVLCECFVDCVVVTVVCLLASKK